MYIPENTDINYISVQSNLKEECSKKHLRRSGNEMALSGDCET